MPVLSTTRFSVGEVNTLITIVTTIVGYSMSVVLAALSLEIRRLMILRGEKRSIVQDNGVDALWKVITALSGGSRWLAAFVILPVLVGYSVSNLLSFATSGVVASTTYVEGDEINVLGLVGEGVADYEVSFPTIDSLTAAVQMYGTSAETMHLSLFSPELSLLGFSSSVLDFESTVYAYASTEGFAVYGSRYNTTEEQGEPAIVTVGLCLEVAAVSGVFSMAECRENIVAETIEKEFEVMSVGNVDFGSQTCSILFSYIPLGNQGVDVVKRNITFTDGTQASATCASIFESIIESCVWKDADALYFGDWNVGNAGECSEDDDNFYPNMTVLGVRYESEVEQGSDAGVLLSAMTAEIFSGTGNLFSRQQLVEILSTIVKLECVEWGVRTAYSPKAAVEIGVRTWVPVMLILAMLLPGIAWLAAKGQSKAHFFLPVTPSEWSACAVMELEAAGVSSTTKPVKPLGVHYDQVYALRPVTAEGQAISQRLGWVSEPSSYTEVNITGPPLPEGGI